MKLDLTARKKLPVTEPALPGQEKAKVRAKVKKKFPAIGAAGMIKKKLA